MFNVIVKYTPWADGRDTFLASRIFEYTDDNLAKQYRQDNSQIDFDRLKEFPTLFIQESYGDHTQIARVGIILRTHLSGREVTLEYAYEPGIPPISNRQLQTFSPELGISLGQFSRTHWSLKSSDLFRVLFKNLHPQRNRPIVFQVADHQAIEPTLVSAMMPFHPAFDGVYATLQRTAEEVGLRCRRADDIWENPAVIQDVVSLIDRSRIVICDCTGRNPNVFYEIGIAHTLGREVILITQSAEDIPFDLRHLRYLQYLNNGEGLAQLAQRLEQRLATLA